MPGRLVIAFQPEPHAPTHPNLAMSPDIRGAGRTPRRPRREGVEGDGALDQVRGGRGGRGGQVGKAPRRLPQLPLAPQPEEVPRGWPRLSGHGGEGPAGDRLQDHRGAVQGGPHQGGGQGEDHEGAAAQAQARQRAPREGVQVPEEAQLRQPSGQCFWRFRRGVRVRGGEGLCAWYFVVGVRRHGLCECSTECIGK